MSSLILHTHSDSPSDPLMGPVCIIGFCSIRKTINSWNFTCYCFSRKGNFPLLFRSSGPILHARKEPTSAMFLLLLLCAHGHSFLIIPWNNYYSWRVFHAYMTSTIWHIFIAASHMISVYLEKLGLFLSMSFLLHTFYWLVILTQCRPFLTAIFSPN